MSESLAALCEQVESGQDLTQQQMASAVDVMMAGTGNAEEIARLLSALHAKGESVEEIAGAAEAMRRHMQPVHTRHEVFIDTCGTGGDGSGTFNISTAAALVTAAAGLPVAKHGNRKITSRSGSADVLSELGVNIEADVATVERCLDDVGVGFCFAPQLHPAMKHVGPIRRNLGTPSIFNLLGPLSNPASAPYQLLGVGKPELRQPLAEALCRLGIRRAAVVCGGDGLDEVTLATETHVSWIADGEVEELCWTPADFQMTTAPLDSIGITDASESAAMIREVLADRDGVAREITILNAAAALWTAGVADSPGDAASRARDAVASGAARQLLERLVEASRS